MAFDRDEAAGSSDASGSDAELEAKLAEARAKRDQINRASGMQRHVHNITVVGVYAIGITIITGVVVWLFHFIAPVNWRYLSDGQIDSLQKILFSGFVGGILGGSSSKLLK